MIQITYAQLIIILIWIGLNINTYLLNRRYKKSIAELKEFNKKAYRMNKEREALLSDIRDQFFNE